MVGSRRAYTSRGGRPHPVTTRFLDCEIDAAARLLRKSGEPVHLTPKAMEVLLLLVARRPAAVSKEDILEQVWPGTFVTDASLARTVHEIRGAIGDGAAVAIRTVHGHGYAFHTEAVPVARSPVDVTTTLDRPVRGWLIVGGRAVPLHDGEVLVGRDPRAAIPLESRLASWHHARLVVSADGVTIEDLASKNGTTVRGQRLTAPRCLEDDDDVVLGGARLVFRTGARVLPTDTDVVG